MAGVRPARGSKYRTDPSRSAGSAHGSAADDSDDDDMSPQDELAEKLVSERGVFVQEQLALLDNAGAGYQQENCYAVFELVGGDKKGEEQLMLIQERQKCCCEPKCCGSKRGFQMDVSTERHNIMTIQRLDPALECCCACRTLCQVKNGHGHIVGEVYHPYRCCETVLLVREPGRGRLWYTVTSGSHCDQIGFCCRCPCPKCMVIKFKIMDRKGREVGEMVRHHTGCAKAAHQVDNFTLRFPQRANFEQRMTLLAALVSIDFIHFESEE